MSATGFLDLFFARSRSTPEALFARFNGAPIAFGALARVAEGLAIELRRRGIRRGDRVVTMMRNSPAALATMFGLARAGAVWVPLNAQLRGPGLGYVLDHCEPALVVADPELMPVIAASGARLSGMPVLSAGEMRPGLRLAIRSTSRSRSPRIAWRSFTPQAPRGRLRV